jgi:hypothetical protein
VQKQTNTDKLTGSRPGKDAKAGVERAASSTLDASVRRRNQLRILESFGTVEYDPAYDYKAERRRQRGQ